MDRFNHLALIFGSGSAAVGIFGLIGMIFGIFPLTRVFSQYHPIALSTVITLILLGLILALQAGGKIPSGWMRTALAGILGVILITGIIELPLNLAGSHFFIEEFFVSISDLLFPGLHSHMSPLTVILVIAASAGLLGLVFPADTRSASRQRREFTGIFGTGIFLVSFTSLLSYLHGTPFLYQTSYTPIALPTVLGSLLFGTGLVFAAGPDTIPLRVFTGTSVRARLLRTFLPLIIAVIVLQNIFQLILFAVFRVQNALVLSSSLVIFSLLTLYVVARVSGSLSDTIERAEQMMETANEALRRSGALLNRTQEIANIGGWEYDIRTKKFYLTEGISRIYEIPVDFNKGPSAAIIPFYSHEDADTIMAAFNQAVSDGEPYDLELPFISGKGKRKWIHATVRIERVEGKVARIYGNIVDITEPKRVEQALRENEERLNRSQKIGHTGSWEFDPATSMIWGSDEGFRMYGLVPPPDHRIPFESIESLIPEHEMVHQALYDLIDGGKPYQLEFLINPADGSPPRYVASIADVIRDGHGSPRKVVGAILDITERKQAEKALRIANQKLHLMNIVAWHDIQNKLTGVRAYLELSKELVEDEQVKNFIRIEEEVLKVIHQQITNTREYQEMGTSPLQWLRAADLIHDARMMSKTGAIEVIVEVDDLELYCDPLTRRVFHHFFDNTIKHARTATRIRIGYEGSPDGITVFYEDNGVGIPDDRKRDLFTRDFGKTYGFDLFFVHDVLEISGMGIAETGSPGNGVRFEIPVPKGSYRFPGRNHTA